MLMTEMVRRGARQFGDRVAVRFADETLSFAEAEDWTNRLAHALIGSGHAPVGARVALLLNNGLFSIPLDFACAAARITRVPLNARLSAREHAQMIACTGATLLVFGPDPKPTSTTSSANASIFTRTRTRPPGSEAYVQARSDFFTIAAAHGGMTSQRPVSGMFCSSSTVPMSTM